MLHRSVTLGLNNLLNKYIHITAIFICLCSCSDSNNLGFITRLHGTITDYTTGAPIENAAVQLSPSGITKHTGANGYYIFEELDVLQYTIIVQKSGYQPNRKIIMTTRGENQQVDIQLIAIPK